MGLGLDFEPDGARGVQTTFYSSKVHQGYQGILHGGIISALLDAAMCNALFQRGVEAVTAEMTVRFHREIPCRSSLTVKAQITRVYEPLFAVSGQLYCGGLLAAESKARFFKRDESPKLQLFGATHLDPRDALSQGAVRGPNQPT